MISLRFHSKKHAEAISTLYPYTTFFSVKFELDRQHTFKGIIVFLSFITIFCHGNLPNDAIARIFCGLNKTTEEAFL